MNKRYFNSNHLFTAGVFALCIICYQLAFKKTVEAWQENRQLKLQVEKSVSPGASPAYTERKDANLTKILELYQADTVNLRSNTISNIALAADAADVKLAQVPAPDAVTQSLDAHFQKLDFEGDYFSLLKVLQRLERFHGVGRVRSAVIRQGHETANESGKKLVMELYFESINK